MKVLLINNNVNTTTKFQGSYKIDRARWFREIADEVSLNTNKNNVSENKGVFSRTLNKLAELFMSKEKLIQKKAETHFSKFWAFDTSEAPKIIAKINDVEAKAKKQFNKDTRDVLNLINERNLGFGTHIDNNGNKINITQCESGNLKIERFNSEGKASCSIIYDKNANKINMALGNIDENTSYSYLGESNNIIVLKDAEMTDKVNIKSSEIYLIDLTDKKKHVYKRGETTNGITTQIDCLFELSKDAKYKVSFDVKNDLNKRKDTAALMYCNNGHGDYEVLENNIHNTKLGVANCEKKYSMNLGTVKRYEENVETDYVNGSITAKTAYKPNEFGELQKIK